MNTTVNFLIFIYVLIQLGYIFNLGMFSLPGIFVLFTSLAIWLVYYFKPKLLSPSLNFPALYVLFCALIFSIILSIIIIDPILGRPGILKRPEFYSQIVYVIKLTQITSLVLALTILYVKNFKFIFYILVTCATILRISFIIASPNPRIDTYDILKFGSQGFIRGQNPYQMTFLPLYPNVAPNYFSYTPGALLLVIPAAILSIDHRFLFVLANLATPLIWMSLSKNSIQMVLMSLIFLFNPATNFVILRGWTDPLTILLLSVISLLIIKNKAQKLTAILIGICVLIKQTMLPIPLFFLKILKNSKIDARIIILTIFAIIVPFVIWSPKDFIYDTIIFHLNNKPRHDAQTLNSLYFFASGHDLPFFISPIIYLASFVLIFGKLKANLAEVFQSMGLWYLIFFLFNSKQAFINYYYFVGVLILLYLTVKLSQGKN